jgi:peptidoglycan hydrolase CwlO-like protein
MADQKATQNDNTAQNILAELSKLQAELGETEKMRATNKSEVKKIEERLRSLGEEVMKKVLS